MAIHKDMTIAMAESAKKKREAELLQQFYGGKLKYKAAIRQIRRLYQQNDVEMPSEDRIQPLYDEARELSAGARQLKNQLKEAQRDFCETRVLRTDQISDKNVISIFESNLTRTIQMRTDELSDALMIIRVFFFDVFQSLINHGFEHNGQKYVCLTASAGQIRTKKCVFIKESLLNQYKDTLMCGLSVEEINARGGCNTNKYLAYLALFNSATDPWLEFDIDRAIVVEDFETLVRGVVDYIDDKTFSVTRKEMDVPICHTDGCGMVLPHLTHGKNMMVRLPWMKGLLAAFPFDEFLAEANERGDWGYGVVKDIYGKVHDVVAEGIQVIFTKSQFKMWKYYDDWEHYKACFKQYQCTAGVCNVEEDIIDNATINYQMLQTLTDLSDDELRDLAAVSNYQLNHMATDTKIMLKALGATVGNPEKTAAQEALLIYPELLQDAYFKNELRDVRRSYIKQAKAGKLALYAKYLFVIPDLYAFCEWLFLGIENPSGLLANGEVYAELFPAVEKLDCLRSPHLYREHPVRTNVCAQGKDLSQWFSHRGIYTSCHDLITKIVQNDNDGDKLLICADKTLVAAAERNMRDIVPLYYEMKKAAAQPITNANIYAGMARAYSTGNIGPTSNNITKNWNSGKADLNIIKILTAINNYTIDAAKTLYTPTPPNAIKRQISKTTNCLVPHFFIYAKDKHEYQVEDANDSCVNRLGGLITKKHISFAGKRYGTFNYTMLMDNPLLIPTKDVEEIGNKYVALMRTLHFWERPADEDADYYSYQFKVVRDEMLSQGARESYVVDAIIYRIFNLNKSVKKRVFWGAFGDIVLKNLRRNLEAQAGNMLVCHHCEARFVPSDQWSMCPSCGRRNAKLKEIVCEDCGGIVYIDPKYYGLQTKCRICYNIYRNKMKLEHKRRLATG